MKAFVLSLLLTLSLSAYSDYVRHIHINGEHLDDANILVADAIFGYTVPNGFYWLNFDTGEWGMEGENQTLGIVQSIQQENQQQYQNGQNQGGYYSQPEINSSQNGSVVSGNVNGQNCTYASAGGTTIRMCE